MWVSDVRSKIEEDAARIGEGIVTCRKLVSVKHETVIFDIFISIYIVIKSVILFSYISCLIVVEVATR